LGLALLGLTGAGAAEKAPAKTEVLPTVVIWVDANLKLTSAEAKIKPGTTLIWVNSGDQDIEITFPGKPVEQACKSPVNFINDEKVGGFYSHRLPRGSVASLCFLDKGHYDYFVLPYRSASTEPEVLQKKTHGMVIVEQ
jgi:plastocyanin